MANESAADSDSVTKWDVPPGPNTLVGTIQVPDTVTVGEAFPVTIHTIGLDTCWESAGQDDEASGLLLEVWTYDHRVGGRPCAEVIVIIPHTEQFTVNEPGEWTIRGHGRLLNEDDADGDGVAIVAERTFIAR